MADKKPTKSTTHIADTKAPKPIKGVPVHKQGRPSGTSGTKKP